MNSTLASRMSTGVGDACGIMMFGLDGMSGSLQREREEKLYYYDEDHNMSKRHKF